MTPGSTGNRFRSLLIGTVVTCILPSLSCTLLADEVRWRQLEPGLEFATVKTEIPKGAAIGDLSVLRVTMDRFDLHLLSARLLDLKDNPTADRWAIDNGMTAVVNAGMFQRDHTTSVGYLRVGNRKNNPHRHKKHKAVLVSGPRKPGLPPVALLDADCDEIWKHAGEYREVVQGIRMISCKGRNVWKPGGRAYRQVSVAIDGKERVLFIFRRSPCTSHQFAEQVRGSGLGVQRMMYLEGGSESSLFVRSSQGDIRLGGMISLLTDLWSNGSDVKFIPIPNVIGIKKKTDPKKR